MSKRKLLLADDSVTIQKVVNLTFADEGIDVFTVGDGNAAIAKISEIAPDVVLADVHMPGLSGYQVCEMVRSNEATRQLPVVLLVGSFEPFDENEAARVGASAYLTKPFQSIRQLVTQVSDLMETSAPQEQTQAPEEPTSAPQEHSLTPQMQMSAPQGFEMTPDIEEVSETDATVQGTVSEAAPTVPGVKIPDTSDIDRLYSQSFSGPGHSDAGGSAPGFVDAGMDDEMIETIHAAQDEPAYAESMTAEEPAEVQHAFAESSTEEYHAPEQPAYGESSIEHAAYEEPSYGESTTTESSGYEEPSYGEAATTDHSAYDEPSYAATSPFEQPVTDEEAAYEAPATENYRFSDEATQQEEPLGELGYGQEETSGQYEAVQQPLESELLEVPKPSSPFDAPAEVDPDAATVTGASPLELDNFVDHYAATQGIAYSGDAHSGQLVIDEEQPLDLPPVADEKAIEFSIRPDGSKEVVSLSPELMDMLVERVKKELTEKS